MKRCVHKARHLKCKFCEIECCSACIGLDAHKCQMISIKQSIEKDLLYKNNIKIENSKIIKF
jgi:hypothetical protein